MPNNSGSESRGDPHRWGDVTIAPGESRQVTLAVSESYSGFTIPIPVVVRRGLEDGPTVFVSAALHGDEINGTGAIRHLIGDRKLGLRAGTLILVPVVNILGFDRHSRYLPDRRDLNRCFPGSRRGSLSSRMAQIVFEEIVGRSNFGIDLHTAAIRRTNFPNVRADVSEDRIRDLAESFGCEVIMAGKGPAGSLRREACLSGCPTIVFEAGEVWKVEPTVVEFCVEGVKNILSHLKMIDREPSQPPYQVTVRDRKWIRAEKGGFLHFHIAPGDLVKQGDSLVTNTSLIGEAHNVQFAPFDAIVLGMTTLPATAPGDPICLLGKIEEQDERIFSIRRGLPVEHPHKRMRTDLATNVMVIERELLPPLELTRDDVPPPTDEAPPPNEPAP